MSVEAISPRLVVVTGIAGAGKTAILNEVCRLIPNAFMLNKDVINAALLHSLSPQSEDSTSVDTPFGKMYSLDVDSDFYRGNIKTQTLLTMLSLADINMNLGKIPVLDIIPVHAYRNGYIERLIEDSDSRRYPARLIHFVASEETAFARITQRMQGDTYRTVRDEAKVSSREEFHKFVTEVEPMFPPELEKIPHLLVDTTDQDPLTSAIKCIEYIRG